MARKKRPVGGPRRHRGGRKFDPNAKRRHTTRAGRRGENDRGSPLLLSKKLAATGRADIEMTASGMLFGRGHLDRAQYDALGYVTQLLQRIARSFGRGAAPAGLWSAILGALTTTTPGIAEIVGDQGARRALERTLRRLDGSRDLVLELAAEGALPAICIRAAEHRLTPRDSVQLELLRKGLDGITPSRGWGLDETG
jgi:hypothetical protein